VQTEEAMRALSGSTWASAVLLAAAVAVSCGPSVSVEPTAGSGGSQTTATGTGGACAGHVYYAGKFDGADPVWADLPAAKGLTGLDAGNAQCVALDIGADHVCDYEEVLLAEAHGELSLIPQGTTAWVQRTTVALVNGQPSEPGLGGTCLGWTYPGDHIAGGEFLTFDQTGVPAFHLDPDATIDFNAPHPFPPELMCHGALRSILCCHPACP
jgi:hypothetical protein